MSPEMDISNDTDALVEYCPESPEIAEITSVTAPEVLTTRLPVTEPVVTHSDLRPPETRVVLVCSLCYRQYDLEEDLRGHMIEYHKCQPLTTNSDDAQGLNEKETRNGSTSMTTITRQMDNTSLTSGERTSLNVAEMRPVPFKDFRLILRRKMTLRCSVFSSCTFKFESVPKREQHAKCHTVAEMLFKCYICGCETNNWRRCSAHLWKLHQLDVDLLKCPVCDFKSPASAIVWRHMRVHRRWRPRVLHSLRAVQQYRLQQRKPSVSKSNEDQPTTVPKRNRYYAEKTCEVCGRKFVNGKTLSKHVKTVHNKIKPFICNICGKKSARKASLAIHMRQHTGEKPLLCKVCKFATRDPSVLHKHQLRHEKAGKFTCSLCDYSCIQTNSYKRHMRLKHAEDYKNIACDLCSFVTISVEKLQAHKEDHRKGLIVNNEDSLDTTRVGTCKNPQKLHDKTSEISADCFLPLESIDSLQHEPAVDTGGVTIPAPSEDTQFPTYLSN